MKVISLINGVPVHKMSREDLEAFRRKSLEKSLNTIGYKLIFNTNINT